MEDVTTKNNCGFSSCSNFQADQTLPANKNQTNVWINFLRQNYWKLTFYLRIVWAQKALVHVLNIHVGRYLCGSACFSSFFFIFCGFLIYHLKMKTESNNFIPGIFPSNIKNLFSSSKNDFIKLVHGMKI